MTQARTWMLVMGAVTFFPLTASANAGTPLLWAGMLHLTVGNAIIGSLEGLALAGVFKLTSKRCVLIMVTANYLSAWLGGVGIAQWLAGTISWDIYTAWANLWLLVAVTFLLTVFLEWPLVAACFERQHDRWRISLKASFLVQLASYVVLFASYWLASGKSFPGESIVVSLDQIGLPRNAIVYFIGSGDGRIHELDLDSGDTRVVSQTNSTNHHDRLVFRISDSNPGEAILCLRREIDGQRDGVIEPLPASFRTNSVEVESDDNVRRDLWFDFGPAKVLGGATNSSWVFRTGFWEAAGLNVRNASTQVRFRLAWETPFSRWPARSAYHLPGDKVIFQFGFDQICVFDAPARTIARLAKGRGVAVALKDPSPAAP